jgi:Zn-dependent peptidase ImmA (M78 family)
MLKPFNPDMLSIRRQALGLTHDDVVSRMNNFISQPTYSRIESGLQKPSQEQVQVLSKALKVYPSFFSHQFYRRPLPDVFHRKSSKLTSSTWEQIFAVAETYRIFLSLLLSAVKISPSRPTPEFCDLNEYGDIEIIANSIRQLWQLPRGPIHDITRLIESAGIVVIPFDFGTNDIDGFSQLATENLPPIIYMNNRLKKDRWRFTIAHELGHLVMHKKPHPNMEDEAHKFAGAFTMPKDDIIHDLYNLSLSHFQLLKIKWKMSVQSLIMRAANIQKITERSKRYYMAEITKLWGSRANEPLLFQDDIEHPRIWYQLIKSHTEKLNFSISEFSQLFGIEEESLPEDFIIKGPKLRLVVSH